MGSLAHIAVGAAGPALGIAWAGLRRRAVERQDARRLASLDSGADESAWLGSVREQVEGCRVSPDLAGELHGRGLLDDESFGRTQAAGYAERYLGRPSGRPWPYMALAALVASGAACGIASGSAWAGAAVSAVSGMAVADLRWRTVPLSMLLALAAMGVAYGLESGATPAAAAVAALALLALAGFWLVANRLGGTGAFGLGDVLLLAELAGVLAVRGGAAPTAFCVGLVVELCATLAWMRLRGRESRPIPFVPFFVVPLAVALAA